MMWITSESFGALFNCGFQKSNGIIFKAINYSFRLALLVILQFLVECMSSSGPPDIDFDPPGLDLTLKLEDNT